MKLRIARKIVKSIGTPREDAYTLRQLTAALKRIDNTKSAREDRKYWLELMDWLGPLGRADLLNTGFRDPAAAFKVLMETPENEWVGYGEKQKC